MKHGKTERETLDLNGWKLGDILEGDEGSGSELIQITAVGEERFLCRKKYQQGNGWGRESGNTTLSVRMWKKISSVEAKGDSADKVTSVGRCASSCLFCRFWKQDSATGGECRRMPPQKVTHVKSYAEGENGDYREAVISKVCTEFPETHATEWCGEFVENE